MAEKAYPDQRPMRDVVKGHQAGLAATGSSRLGEMVTRRQSMVCLGFFSRLEPACFSGIAPKENRTDLGRPLENLSLS